MAPKGSNEQLEWSKWEWYESKQLWRSQGKDRKGFVKEIKWSKSIPAEGQKDQFREVMDEESIASDNKHTVGYEVPRGAYSAESPYYLAASTAPSGVQRTPPTKQSSSVLYSTGIPEYPTRKDRLHVITPESDQAAYITSLYSANYTYEPRQLSPHYSVQLSQELDVEPVYKLHPSNQFKLGRVFQTLWTEPKALKNPQKPATTNSGSVKAKYGEDYYQSIRQFVIVEENEGHCLCLSILAYENIATVNSKNDARDYAMVHTGMNTKGKRLIKEIGGEMKLLKRPIQIHLHSKHQTESLSFLNYTKIYTVECNIEVMFIGKIHSRSMAQFRSDYNLAHPPLVREVLEESESDDDLLGEKANIAIDKDLTISEDENEHNRKDPTGGATTQLLITPESGTKPVTLPMVMQTKPLYDTLGSLAASASISGSISADSGYESLISSYNNKVPFISSFSPSQLTALLTEDRKFSALILKASKIVPPESFQKMMGDMLLRFATNLIFEAKSDMEKQATEVIRQQARNITSDLSRKIYQTQVSGYKYPSHQTPLAFEKRVENIDSILLNHNPTSINLDKLEASLLHDKDRSEDVGQATTHQYLIESFIKPSQALDILRNDLAKVLYLDEAKSPATKERLLSEGSDTTKQRLSTITSRIERSSFDHIYSVLSRVWPKSVEYFSTQIVQYLVYWDILHFITSHFVKGQQLGSIITLTGDANDAEALPCRNYLEKTWPTIAGILLDSLEELVRTSARGRTETEGIYIFVETGSNSQCAPTANKSLLTFSVYADFEQHHDIISAISWLCAAVRHGDSEVLSISKAFLETTPRTDQTRKILIKMHPLVPITENRLCWHSLFAFSVIAYEFPISPRKAGHGLELSFQAMLMLARSIRVTEFNDGLVAEGLENLIVPVAKLEEDDALQWHLEWKDPTLPATEISLGSASLNRYKTKNLQELISKRTFLGWTENALVMLGTEQFNQSFPLENVKRSEATVLRKVGFRPKSYDLAFGVNAIPGLYIQGQTMFVQASDGNYTAKRGHDKLFRDRLQDSAKRNVMVTDWSSETSWYLPETNVILYMIHLYLELRGYSIFLVEVEINTPGAAAFYAVPSADGGEAARETLSDSTNLRFGAGGTLHAMDYLIRKYLFELELERQELHDVLKTARELKKGPPGSIVGYELLDVILEPPDLLAKVMKFRDSQPWAFLSEVAPVLFVRDFGQAIVARDRRALCDPWMQVPPGRNYLVAAAPAIKNLLESNGGRKLSDQVIWEFAESLIKTHQTGNKSPVSHTQTLRSLDSLLFLRRKEQKNPWDLILAVINGAFIFGQPLLKKGCHSSVAPAGMQSSVDIHTDEDESRSEGIILKSHRVPGMS